MIYKLNPVLKEYIWAGENLKNKYNKKTDLDKISESFEFSVLDDNESTFSNKSRTLKLSEVVPKSKMLIKLIDASKDLSVQVHPSDEYAKKHFNKLGKSECWYILGAKDNAFIYLGFNNNYTREEVETALSNNTICSMLNKYYVKPGEFYKISPGTVHAIGSGVTLYEIQESSDLTFRLYDYDRIDKNGKKRELHIKDALNVLDYSVYKNNFTESSPLISNEYFELLKIDIDGLKTFNSCINNYMCITLIEGKSIINGLNVNKGESVLVEPDNKIIFNGNGTALLAISK